MRQRHIPLLMALAIPCAVWAGQVYEWKDASGKSHFSDKPPTGVEAKPLGIMTNPPKPSGPPAGAGAPTEAPKTWAERNADFGKRKAEEAEEAAKADEAQKRLAQQKQACENAQQRLKMLESGMRVQRLNEKGERIVLDDAARAEEITRAKEDLERACAK
jgi:hypothetical protein